MRVAGRTPNTLARISGAMKVIRSLGRGEEADLGGTVIKFPWVKPGAELPVWMAAYGPKALKMTGEEADGFILQLSDLYLTEYMVKTVKDAAVAAGRDPSEVKICVAAPAYITEDDSPEALAHAREQCRWFGGMVGNHVADIVKRYGEGGDIPRALTDYIKAREGYDYSHHGRVGNPDTEFVPDEIVERFCVLGTVEDHVAKLRELEGLGVDQFNIYLMHDAMDPTLDAYGSDVIPAMTSGT
jgi:probable F420-dependent oxidoreductase